MWGQRERRECWLIVKFVASVLGKLAVWEFEGAREIPKGGAQEDEGRIGESRVPRGSGPSVSTEKWLGKTPTM